MKGVIGVASVLVAASGVACANIAGLSDYASCAGGCDASANSTGPVYDATSETGASETGATSDAAHGADGTSSIAPGDDATSDDGSEGAATSDGASPSNDASQTDGSGGGGTDASPSEASAGNWACAKGGCNAAGGSCAAAGPCFCTNDDQCGSGKCVITSGHNDLSCGSGCTGSSPADGFQCALGDRGIPASCTGPSFGYAPINVSAMQLAQLSPVGAVDLGCAGTVTFNGTTWSGATCSQSLPTVQTVAQSGGPNIDVLAFQGLTIASGVTLNLTGPNAVMIVVFGDASIAGTIDASGAEGAPNSSNPGASGPGGNFNCGASAGGQGSSGHTGGGGGGGAQSAGGVGAAGVGGTGGTAGSAFAAAATHPLRGGCPGGTSGSWACSTSGGGGGGALEIAAAGTITVSGTITANGGNGGTSTCASTGCAPGPNHTYGGGGGGGGSGGTIVLQAATVVTSGTVTPNGGAGGNPDEGIAELGSGGGGGTSSAESGNAGTGDNSNGCGADNENGGGGGGAYGYADVASGETGEEWSCTTTLSPAPVCNSSHAACLCVADSDCSSGKCVDADSQCSGASACTGSGDTDLSDCALATAVSGP